VPCVIRLISSTTMHFFLRQTLCRNTQHPACGLQTATSEPMFQSYQAGRDAMLESQSPQAYGISLFFPCCNSPSGSLAASVMMFLHHTPGRTPLKKRSACSRGRPEHPCPQQYSNPLSQVSSGRRPATASTPWPPGLAPITLTNCNTCTTNTHPRIVSSPYFVICLGLSAGLDSS